MWTHLYPVYGCCFSSHYDKLAGVHFELKGVVYGHNSTVNMAEVGEGENALVCKTNKPNCCRTQKAGEFYYPNSVRVPIRSLNHVFFRDRREQSVRLNRRVEVDDNVYLPTGAFCCEVPDACNVKQKICINLMF